MMVYLHRRCGGVVPGTELGWEFEMTVWFLFGCTVGRLWRTTDAVASGGPQSRHATALLTGTGLAAQMPTAIADANDRAGMSWDSGRLGVVHAKVFANIGSLVGLRGNTVLVGSGYLGRTWRSAAERSIGFRLTGDGAGRDIGPEARDVELSARADPSIPQR